jgi:F420-0:gamma-glutamyl ligase-like protein
MADKKLPQKAPILHLERAEFAHIVNALEGIKSRAGNLLVICEAVDVRASNEFAESMKIIRGLQPENEGGEA